MRPNAGCIGILVLIGAGVLLSMQISMLQSQMIDGERNILGAISQHVAPIHSTIEAALTSGIQKMSNSFHSAIANAGVGGGGGGESRKVQPCPEVPPCPQPLVQSLARTGDCPACPQCQACPDCVCNGGGGGGGEWQQTLPPGIVKGVIESFLSDLTEEDRNPATPTYLTGSEDQIGRKLRQLKETGDCKIVEDTVSSSSSSSSSDVHLITWDPAFLDYDNIEEMSQAELAVALGFLDNHELNRGIAERRMDAISKFKRREYTQLAQTYGGAYDDLYRCFGAQMEHREELKKQRFLLLSDHYHISESGQSHNEIVKKCHNECANSAFCYTGGKEGSNEHNRLQQLADLLLRPSRRTYHWLGREQMVMLLKRRLAERQRELETILRWNLCHPSISKITVLVRDHHLPPHLDFVSHPKLTVKRIYPSISFGDALKEVSSHSSSFSAAIVARNDVVIGGGITEKNWIKPGEAFALSPHNAAPSLQNGISPLSFCDDGVGGGEVAFAFGLPLNEEDNNDDEKKNKKNKKNDNNKNLKIRASYISTALDSAEEIFVQAMCDAGIEVSNPCKRVKTYLFTEVQHLRRHRQLGIDSRYEHGNARSCNPSSSSSSSSCCSVHRVAAPVAKDDHSWEQLLKSGLYLSHGEDKPFDGHAFGYSDADMLPLTQAVQKFLYDWQHPQDCRSAKFMRVLDNGNNGIGSLLHTATYSLGKALDEGRVLIMNSGIGGHFTDDWCQNTRSLLCYFLPPTHCEIDGSSDVVDAQRPSPAWTNPSNYATPRRMEKWLQEREVNVASYYWWRGQAVAYLARLNPRAKEEILRRRKAAWDNGLVVTANTVSAHVRHGDKASEMRLIPFSEYVKAATTSLPSRKMFISTEDPGVIEEAKRGFDGWEMLWVQQERVNGGPMDHTRRFGATEEFLNSWLNLMIALECDSFVGTRGSNWNRLIDELRGIWSGKARAPYLEVGDQQFGW